MWVLRRRRGYPRPTFVVSCTAPVVYWVAPILGQVPIWWMNIVSTLRDCVLSPFRHAFIAASSSTGSLQPGCPGCFPEDTSFQVSKANEEEKEGLEGSWRRTEITGCRAQGTDHEVCIPCNLLGWSCCTSVRFMSLVSPSIRTAGSSGMTRDKGLADRVIHSVVASNPVAMWVIVNALNGRGIGMRLVQIWTGPERYLVGWLIDNWKALGGIFRCWIS